MQGPARRYNPEKWHKSESCPTCDDKCKQSVHELPILESEGFCSALEDNVVPVAAGHALDHRSKHHVRSNAMWFPSYLYRSSQVHKVSTISKLYGSPRFWFEREYGRKGLVIQLQSQTVNARIDGIRSCSAGNELGCPRRSHKSDVC